MTDMRVLHEGRMRRQLREAQARRRRRRRQARRLLAALVLAALAILALDAAQGDQPSLQPPQRQASVKPSRPSGGESSQVGRSPYGATPDRIQIHPRLRLGLSSGLLFDVRTGQVLWQRRPDTRLPIASLTKMMTALVTVTHASPRSRVLITRAAKNFSGSGVGLLPLGKRVSEEALLYGLLLPSGNDAAIALAQHIAGTQRHFVELMNREARAMHLTCTHFSTVSGIVDQDNYSCARDLAAIAHAVLTQATLRRIVAARSAILPFPIKGGKLYLYNNNPLLVDGYPGADGVKTGFTTKAGLCLVAAARRGHDWLGVVLLHSGNWTTQATLLLDAGFAALRPPKTAVSVAPPTRRGRTPPRSRPAPASA